MTVWETEDDFAASAPISLSSPSDSSFSSRARMHPKPVSLRPTSSSSIELREIFQRDDSEKKDDPLLEPHRFTPNLHANFVSEILGLRRSVEAKKKEIENLETTLFETKGENEVFSAGFASISKENHLLKRKLELVETGTSTALSEVLKDRENAVEAASEAKRRLDRAQKKIRSQDGEIDRLHALWARDKSNWEEEKRKMECKIHVAENRLKSFLEEVATYEMNETREHDLENKVNMEIDSLDKHGSETESVLTRSLTNSVRFSMLNGLAELNTCMLDGLSLACELNVDDDDFNHNTDRESITSTNSSNYSLESNNLDLKSSVQRNSNSNNGSRSSKVVLEKVLPDTFDEKVSEKRFDKIAVNFERSDPKIECSRLISTDVQPKDDGYLLSNEKLITEDLKKHKEPLSKDFDQEETIDMKEKISTNNKNTTAYLVASPEKWSSQECFNTSESIVSSCNDHSPLITRNTLIEMESKSVQTDELVLTSSKCVPPPLVIPSIQLHPPISAPATPEEHYLPQHFKDVGSQVNLPSNVPTRTISVQTEDVRVDKQVSIVPACLQDSAISSNTLYSQPVRRCPSLAIAPKTKDLHHIEDYSSIDNNLSVISKVNYPKICDAKIQSKKQPLIESDESGTLTYELEHLNSDVQFTDDNFNDGIARTPLSALRLRKRSVSADKITQRYDTSCDGDKLIEKVRAKSPDINHLDQFRNLDQEEIKLNQIEDVIEKHQDSFHQHCSTSEINKPPFPIPARHSSRRPCLDFSEFCDSPTWFGSSSLHRRSKSIRKVRSATAISDVDDISRRCSKIIINSTSPPPMSYSANDYEIWPTPSLTDNEVSSRRISVASYKGYSSKNMSRNTISNVKDDLLHSDGKTSLVSAITHGMIGEWVYKYTRHRKSLGVSESIGNLDTSRKIRHKRWIWLAPYERAVMWSSKEPASGTALRGKNVRKLIIENVLVIKDENPAPKGVSLINRSILILSPARALKFTATSMERHNIWLTALSFLAHSHKLRDPSTPISDSNNLKLNSQSRCRRVSIRDSIRVAKAKSNLVSRSVTAQDQSPQLSSGVNPVIIAESFCKMEDSNVAADAPIVPRFTDRSAPNFIGNNTTSSFLPLYHRKRSNTSPRNILPSPRRSSKPLIYSNKSFASTVGLSAVNCENSEMHQFNSCYLPSTTSHDYIDSEVESHPNASFNRNKNYLNSETSSPINCSFFETVGTVRMQAFVSHTSSDSGSENEKRHNNCKEQKSQLNNENKQILRESQKVDKWWNTYVNNSERSIKSSSGKEKMVEKPQEKSYVNDHEHTTPFPCL